MTEDQGKYVTKQEVDDANEMLGAGYVIHPPAQVLEMQEDYSLEKKENIAWVKIDVGFRGVMKKLKGSQLSVFLAISLRINNQGLCYPSFETIAEDTGYSLRAVKTAAKKLQDAGFLTIVKGKMASNMYHVNAFAAFGESNPDSAEIALGANSDTPECKNEHGNMSGIALKEESINKNQEEETTLVEKEIFKSANKTMDAFLANEQVVHDKLAKNETYPYREEFPEPIRELLDVYVKITGQKPLKSNVSDWLLTGQDWLDLEIKPIDLQMAYDKSKPESGPGFTVARPGSLTLTAGVFSGERRKKGYDSDLSAVDRIAAKFGV